MPSLPSTSRGLSTVLVATLAVTAVLPLAAQENEKKRPEQPARSQAPNFPGAPLINSRPPFLAGIAVSHADGVYEEGETLDVAFKTERDAYLYLLYHQADGQSLLLFPNPAKPEHLIKSRELVRVPAPGENFRFRIRPPFGTEFLQVLAAKKSLRELDQLLQAGGGRAARIPPDVFKGLAARLRKDPSVWTEHHTKIETFPKEKEPPERAAKRIGLFIGIGEYKNPQIAATHEELRHSAEVIHQRMLKRGGLDPDLTRLIVDQEATREHIQELFLGWLPSVSEPGDVVFIYFSGHSGQIPTADRSEPDGLDELLAPWEIDAGADDASQQQRHARMRETGILDDTLARWLQELVGRQVVLIVDTCHAGGLADAKSLGGVNFFVDEAARVKDITQLNTIILSCCAADERALFEGTPDKTMWFTHFLNQAIEAAEDGLTVTQAFQQTNEAMRNIVIQLSETFVQAPTLTDNVLLPVYIVP